MCAKEFFKASIRRYCNDGHDIVTAQGTALRERTVKGTTATVCSIQEQFQTLEINNIPGYSSLHNFEFSEGGLCVWKASGVGLRKLISWTDTVTSPHGETNFVEEIQFFATNYRRIGAKEQARAGDSEYKRYECPKTNCTEEFDTQEDLDLHMNVYSHRTVPSQPVKVSLKK